LRVDRIDRGNDVRARLALDHQQHGRSVVVEAAAQPVFDRIRHCRDIAQPYRCAVAVADDERQVLFGPP